MIGLRTMRPLAGQTIARAPATAEAAPVGPPQSQEPE